MSRSRRFLFPFLLLLALVAWTASAETSKEVRRTVPLAAGGSVAVDTYKGSVDVTAEERADVVVEARVTPDRGCGDEAAWAEWVDRTDVRVEETGGGVRIVTDYGRLDAYHRGFLGWCTARPFVAYRIRMPRSAPLAIKDHKSTIDVASLSAPLRLESYKGKVSVRDLAGSLRLDTYKGEALVAFARLGGDSSVETHKGEIELSLPKGSGFTLDADSGRHGRIRSDFEVPAQAVSRRSGDVLKGAVNGGGPRLRATTYKGTIRLVAR